MQVDCTISECLKPQHAKTYCTKHYQRFKKYGTPDLVLYLRRGSSHEHPLRNVYMNMLARCYNPKNPRYADWGGRGIRVCKRWNSEGGFTRFIADMGPRPEGFSLDRIDVNGNYKPLNCRWADKYTQAANTQAEHIYPGVGWHGQRQKYRARIKINGRELALGLYDSLDQAIAARKSAERALL